MSRILFITEDYPSGLNGTSVKTRNTLLFLLKQNVEIDLCCVHNGEIVNRINLDKLRTFIVEKKIPPKLSTRNILRIIRLLISLNPLFVQRLFTLELNLLIKTLLKSNEYSYVIYDGYSTLIHVIKTQAEQIYIDDEDITDLLLKRFQSEKFWLKKIQFYVDYFKSKIYEKKYLIQMDQVWAISPNTKKRLQTLTPAKTVLMPTYIPLAENIYDKKSKDVVFTGTLSWEENIVGLKWFLQNYWPGIVRTCPNSTLHIIGREANFDLVEFIKSFPQVKYWGYVEDLKKVYENCAVAISPVLINAGIKVKILTYLRFGLPVVATEKSVLGLVSTKGVKIGTQKNFGSEVTSLLQSSTERQLLSQAGHLNIKQNYNNRHLELFLKKNVCLI